LAAGLARTAALCHLLEGAFNHALAFGLEPVEVPLHLLQALGDLTEL
jgi:hypothetical protein